MEYREWKYPDFDYYYEKIITLSERTSEIRMEELFKLEFDKVYVAREFEESYADEEYFLEKLGVSSDINIPVLESESRNRMLFIKDDKIIRDFIYEIYKLRISETEFIVYPETNIMVVQGELNNDAENAIKIILEDVRHDRR